jgi:WD40 repeat protein
MFKYLLAGLLVLVLLGTALADAVSPDGKLKATPDGSAIKVIDVASGKDVLALRGHTANVTSLVFTPDGKLLLSGGLDKSVLAWEVASGKLLWKQSADAAIKDVDIAKDGKTAIITTAGGKLLVDVATGKRVQ